jgi:hypothetical protein
MPRCSRPCAPQFCGLGSTLPDMSVALSYATEGSFAHGAAGPISGQRCRISSGADPEFVAYMDRIAQEAAVSGTHSTQL